MKMEKMRVFQGLVNYGTQSGFFAFQLRKQGINALSVTEYDNFSRITDITLKHSGRNILEKIYNQLYNTFYLTSCFFNFNIFHFYFGKTLFRSQIDLPFYKIFGKKVIFHYLGFDVQLYEYSNNKYELNNLRFVFNNRTGIRHDRKIKKRLKFETKYADLQIVCAPCYSEFVSGSILLPLAIDLDEYIFLPKETNRGAIQIMHAPTNRDNKGSSYIIKAIDQLIAEGYNITKVLVENVSHKELKRKYDECDIFVDQIVGGWYGTAAIEAMAIGRPTVCFLRETYFEYIDFTHPIPVINAEPKTIYEVLKKLVENKEELPLIGVKSRKFVEDIHDLKQLTNKLISMYVKL